MRLLDRYRASARCVRPLHGIVAATRPMPQCQRPGNDRCPRARCHSAPARRDDTLGRPPSPRAGGPAANGREDLALIELRGLTGSDDLVHVISTTCRARRAQGSVAERIP